MIFFRSNTKRAHRARIIIGCLLLVMFSAASIAIGAVALYRYRIENAFTRTIAWVVGLPAAEFDGRFVSYRDYAKNLASLERFYLRRFQAGDFEQPVAEELRVQALERLIFDTFVSGYAREHGIVAPRREVITQVDLLASMQGGRMGLNAFLRDYYGWSTREYVRRFLIPAMRYQSVQEYIRTNDPDNVLMLRQATEALAKVQAGESFESVAAVYGAETGVENPGEPFLFPASSMPAEIAQELSYYEVGEISDILFFPASLQIIKVLERDVASGLLRVQRIYFPIRTIEQLMIERRESTPVHSFVL